MQAPTPFGAKAYTENQLSQLSTGLLLPDAVHQIFLEGQVRSISTNEVEENETRWRAPRHIACASLSCGEGLI